jgi:hypothetical protein
MHDSIAAAADTTSICSSYEDYSVFLNQPKDFVLKLTLHETGKCWMNDEFNDKCMLMKPSSDATLS